MAPRAMSTYPIEERKAWDRLQKLVLRMKTWPDNEAQTGWKMAKEHLKKEQLRWENRPMIVAKTIGRHFPNPNNGSRVNIEGWLDGKPMRDWFRTRDWYSTRQHRPFVDGLVDIFKNNNCVPMRTITLAEEGEKLGYKKDINKVSNTLQRHCSTSPQYKGGPDLFEPVKKGLWRLKS